MHTVPYCTAACITSGMCIPYCYLHWMAATVVLASVSRTVALSSAALIFSFSASSSLADFSAFPVWPDTIPVT